MNCSNTFALRFVLPERFRWAPRLKLRPKYGVFQPIENCGVIGNMRSIALVGMNGSIDFLYYPEFDSPTMFAALLDAGPGWPLSNRTLPRECANTPAALAGHKHPPDALPG